MTYKTVRHLRCPSLWFGKHTPWEGVPHPVNNLTCLSLVRVWTRKFCSLGKFQLYDMSPVVTVTSSDLIQPAAASWHPFTRLSRSHSPALPTYSLFLWIWLISFFRFTYKSYSAVFVFLWLIRSARCPQGPSLLLQSVEFPSFSWLDTAVLCTQHTPLSRCPLRDISTVSTSWLLWISAYKGYGRASTLWYSVFISFACMPRKWRGQITW